MDTKDQILKAAFRLFADKGYNTSMSDIAKQVGIKVPSIYSHFKSKDEIISLMMSNEINYFFDNLNFQINILNKADENCEMKLKTICFSVFTYFSKPDRIKFWMGISSIYNEELRAKEVKLFKENQFNVSMILKQIFIEGKNKGEIKYDSIEGTEYLFRAMIHGVLESILIYNDIGIDMDDYKRMIWQAYWDGIKA